MKEFGSDFHMITEFQSHRAHLNDVYRDAVLMADGRQCIVALIRQEKWHRLWMPEYFCYEVIDTIKQQTGIEICFYPDFPLANDSAIIQSLPFEEGDVILRMNFFGIREKRINQYIHIPVIEDHTHDILGHWSLYSDADWCIASLRKSLPLPEGGMLWSPKGHNFDVRGIEKYDHSKISDKRWLAMQMKSDFLDGNLSDKESFRRIFIDTEEWFDVAGPMDINIRTKKFISQFDVNSWLLAKRRNLQVLQSLLIDRIKILKAEDDSCNVFSLILIAEDSESRDGIRRMLIDNSVYPAILWNVPNNASREIKDFSSRMLSIHCDGRYSEEDMKQLADIINKAIVS